MCFGRKKWKPTGSNRTFMELKFGYLADTTPNRTGSNRTFMELKYDFERLIDSQKIRSNRTFMELKSRT